MAKLKVIVAVSAFFGVLALGAGLIAQQNPGGGGGGGGAGTQGAVPLDRTVRGLIQQRIELAGRIFDSAIQRNKETPGKEDLPGLAIWSRQWMDEQIHGDSNPAQNLAAIQAHLERTRRLEAMADEAAKAGNGHPDDALKLKYTRLQAEQMLAEMRIINPNLFPARPAARP